MKFRELLPRMTMFTNPATARFIAERFGMTLSHAHQDLKRLYKMGFVTRKKHPKDGRKFVT